MVEDNGAVIEIMRQAGMNRCGIAPFGPLGGGLIQCSSLRRLPVGARSVAVALFPYYTGARGQGNISKYAAVKDYHIVAGRMLESAAGALSEKYPGMAFQPFCDASPIPEVEAARLAGLGVRGRNGLLINEKYGSYVFIGEIVTDLEIAPSQPSQGGCRECGKCAESCPSHALADGFDRQRCVSAITQKRGELAAAEQGLIRKAGSIWGCDICQDACPMNMNAAADCLGEFKNGVKTEITMRELCNVGFAHENADRAFMWKGTEILRRNLCILRGTSEDNKQDSTDAGQAGKQDG